MKASIYFFLRYLMLPTTEIDSALPASGVILDLGCGIGTLAQYLAQASTKRKVIGWDIDESRIIAAQKIASKIPNVKFQTKNVLEKITIKELIGIVASDFFHHLHFAEQEKIIRNISMILKNGGILVIKEVDNGQKVRALLSLFWDRLFYPNKISYFRTKDDWIRLLEKNKFSVKIKKTMWWFPGSQTLFICKKQS